MPRDKAKVIVYFPDGKEVFCLGIGEAAEVSGVSYEAITKLLKSGVSRSGIEFDYESDYKIKSFSPVKYLLKETITGIEKTVTGRSMVARSIGLTYKQVLYHMKNHPGETLLGWEIKEIS